MYPRLVDDVVCAVLLSCIVQVVREAALGVMQTVGVKHTGRER